jgi:hypothetical protein
MKNRNVQQAKKQYTIFTYEKSKSTKVFLYIMLTTLFSQISSFLFFGLVGKLETEEVFLNDFQTVFALSSTITMCVLSILGTVFIRKKVTQLYIGNQRYRTFLFPIKRSKLFIMKMAAFLFMAAAGVFLGMFSGLLLSVCLNVLLQLNTGTLFSQCFSGLVICLAVMLLTVSVIAFSAVVAIWRQSETAAIVASVLSVLVVSNLFAVGAIGNSFIFLTVHLIIGFVFLQLLFRFSKRIDGMDV